MTASQDINVLVVDLCAPGVAVRVTGPNERQRTVPSFGDAINAEAVVNADFFQFADYSPTGPALHAGNRWGGTDTNFVAPLLFGPNQVELPVNTKTDGLPDWATEVVSGHPSIVVDGAVRENTTYAVCTALNPRTAAGLSEDRKTLVLAVVDGRATDRIGMTCGELGALMIELGAHSAVNLDGGGSSTMWLSDRGVVNHPSDGAPRVVANHLAIRANGAGPAPFCVAPPGPVDPPVGDAGVGDAADPGEPGGEPTPDGGCAAAGNAGLGSALAMIALLRRRRRATS